MSAVMESVQQPVTASATERHDLLAIDLIRYFLIRQMQSLEPEERWWQAFAAFYADIVRGLPVLQEIAVEVATDRILALHGCEPWSVARRRWPQAG